MNRIRTGLLILLTASALALGIAAGQRPSAAPPGPTRSAAGDPNPGGGAGPPTAATLAARATIPFALPRASTRVPGG